MNFQDIFYKIQDAYENADARNIFEHIAIEFHIIGDFEGIFYLEVVERQICVEPYEYHDADAVVTLTTDVISQLLDNSVSTVDAVEKGLVKVEGNLEKVMILQKMVRKKDV